LQIAIDPIKKSQGDVNKENDVSDCVCFLEWAIAFCKGAQIELVKRDAEEAI